MRSYFVYIMTNNSLTSFYTGVTNDLGRRVLEHRQRTADSFTARYNIRRLVYAEEGGSVWDVIAREKQIKRWRREKKVALVRTLNPSFRDLAEDWGLISPAAGGGSGALGRGQTPDPSTPLRLRSG
jgi:putative endonuclease